MIDPAGIVWWGTEGSLEAMIVRQHHLTFRALTAAPLVGVRGAALIGNALRLALGTWRVWRAMGRAGPEAVFVTGGYVSVPLAIAARLRRVPLVVYLPDVRPGLAVRLIGRLADRVAVTCEAAAAYFPSRRTVVTGYPVRTAIRAARRDEARARFGLAPEATVVLVFGGSQGARRLNEAVASAAARLLDRVALIHASGPREHQAADRARSALPEAARSRYHLHPFLQVGDMAAALAAADLVVCRAGAATLGELPARGLPAILVPLPIASGHQDDNANMLVEAGAAVVVDDSALDGDRLVAEVKTLVDDPARLAAMGAAARRLDRPGAAAAIGRLLLAVAGRESAAHAPRPAHDGASTGSDRRNG